MIKEALQYLVGLGNARTEKVEEQVYSTGNFQLLNQPTASPVKLNSLSGIVDYIKSNYDKQPSVLIQVVSPTKVNVMSTFNRDMNRNYYLESTALLPSIAFGHFMDMESFNILLQSCFVNNEDRAKLLAIVGNVKEENVQTIGDDGISQQVTAKAGVATVAQVPVPNPVLLKPFRTFSEVVQPMSAFVFRMKNGPTAALYEADGGAWKITAIKSIKEYLEEQLSKEISSGKVVVIA